jgi:excinuclease UvrABC nuclease subunit
MERRAAYQVGTWDTGHGTGEIPPLDEIPFVIKRLEKEMQEAAKRLEFERAAELRDRIRYLRGILYGEAALNKKSNQEATPSSLITKKRRR